MLLHRSESQSKESDRGTISSVHGLFSVPQFKNPQTVVIDCSPRTVCSNEVGSSVLVGPWDTERASAEVLVLGVWMHWHCLCLWVSKNKCETVTMYNCFSVAHMPNKMSSKSSSRHRSVWMAYPRPLCFDHPLCHGTDDRLSLFCPCMERMSSESHQIGSTKLKDVPHSLTECSVAVSLWSCDSC